VSAGWFLCGAFIGFIWGQFFAGRSAAKKGDVAMRLIASMVDEVLEKRRFVGRGPAITRMESFDIKGEPFTLSVSSRGGVSAIESEAA
jgi:hypothetical protein